MLVAALGCASVQRPPKLAPNASEAERRIVYEKYRLDPFNEDSVMRMNDRLNTNQLARLAEDCPKAKALIDAPPRGPLVLAGIGGGMLAYGLTSRLVREGEIGYDGELDGILAAVGGGALALGVLLQLILQPAPSDLDRASAEYNQCLRRQLELDNPQPLGVPPRPKSNRAEYPWRVSPPPSEPSNEPPLVITSTSAR